MTSLYLNFSLHVHVTSRFGVINALKTSMPVSKSEEFTLSYGYTFDEGPLWYKDLFLEFMSKYPQHTRTIEHISEGRSKKELVAAYHKYIADDSIAKMEAFGVD